MKTVYKLVLAFTIPVVAMLVFGYISLSELAKVTESLQYDIPNSINQIQRTSELDSTAQFIRYYDEVLTQSARNFAFTQDTKWEERYKIIEPELDRLIKITIASGDETEKQFFQSVDAANRALVEMEYNSIALVNQGKSDEAIKILESDEYWNQKKIYEQGLRDYVTKRGAAYDQAIVVHTQKLDDINADTQVMLDKNKQLFSIAITIIIAIVIVLAAIIVRNISGPIRNLIHAANEIANGNYDIQIDSKSTDELGKLTTTFNLMANSLKKSMLYITAVEKRYQNLYEGSPLLLRTIDTNGIVIDCNKAYADSLGCSKEELIGKSIFETVAEGSLEQMKESFEAWKSSGYVENREIWLKRKDGTSFPALLSATNLYDSNGKITGSNTALKDISDIYQARKKLEESQRQIKEQYDQLKQSNKVKDEFLAMITHELKTPLVPIKGYADMLLSEHLGPLNEKQKQRLDIIRSSTISLLKILGDLLDAQKLDLGQLKLSKDLHNISDLIRDIIDKMKLVTDSKGITIWTKIQSDIFCICDKVRIEEVITNLINNAVNFCPKEKEGVIEIMLRMEGSQHARIVIKDNGVGISKENLEKIFVKFYQVDTSSTREHGGTGLGLSVCKGIIENHGGKIWAESQGVGMGAEVHITLPECKILEQDKENL